jgi:16S rRNA (guanine527-N7)-methyltransferase
VQVVDAESFSAATGVSRETIDQLLAYEALLRKWQGRINLISPSSLNSLWNRHFWDSAQLSSLAPEEAHRWIDLGSGAGFPGLIIAILRQKSPDFRVLMIESDHRKSAFLSEAIRITGAPAEVRTVRIEDFTPDQAPDVISARALAPLGQLLGWTSSFWGKATIGLFPKGRTAGEELTEAAKGWIFEHEAIASQSDPSGTVLKLWGLNHANPRHAVR